MNDHLPQENCHEIEARLQKLERDKRRLWRALERLCEIAEFRGLVIGPQDARQVLAETKS